MDGKLETRKIARQLLSLGWRVTKKRKHYQAIPPDPSKPLVHFGDSISDYRAVENIKSRLRKSGIDLKKINQL